MKGDLHPCAVRLMQSLPVRTHERRLITHVQGSKAPPKIIIDHRTYDSIMDASRKLKRDRNAIRLMLKKGTASYA